MFNFNGLQFTLMLCELFYLQDNRINYFPIFKYLHIKRLAKLEFVMLWLYISLCIYIAKQSTVIKYFFSILLSYVLFIFL